MNIVLHMNRILSFFCIAFLLSASINLTTASLVSAEAAAQNLVVVELFTSQGCNSCPPADDLLAELSQQENILALSYNVDYWNYLGWKDTFAQPASTARQRKYNRSLGKSGVYTPQMVIQGRHDAVGSKADLVRKLIEQAESANKLPSAPDITFDDTDSMMSLTIGAHIKAPSPAATIWIIGYDYARTVDIKRGELGGQVRTYHNVVRAIKRIGSWMGEDIKLTLSAKDIGREKYGAYAVLLQADAHGPIIAAAKLTP